MYRILGINVACLCIGWLGTTAGTVANGDDWPQWGGINRDHTWAETGLIEKFPDGGPTIVWRQPILSGYSGPAVAGGRVFVGDYRLTEGNPTPNPSARSKIEGFERLLCLDAATGKQWWVHEYECPYRISYPAGPRCTPVVDGDRVYMLGAEGKLFCLKTEDGSLVWERDLKSDYGMAEAPIWGFSAHPLVHGQMLYCVVGGEGSIAVAFDKLTGKEIWRGLDAKEPGYCPPVIFREGGKEQLVIWHPESINGLDPQTGSVYWSAKITPQHAMSIAAPARTGSFVFASGLGASILLRLDAATGGATEIWRDKGFNTSHSPVFADGEHLYGVDRTGYLRCIDIKTGKRLWQTTEPITGPRPANPGTGFLVKNGDRFLIAGETGELTIARLSPEGYEKIDSAKLLEPTHDSFGHKALWSCPAYADGRMYWRNDKEIICVSLSPEEP
jgi:outer membrane protein assembly factor BamB